MSEAPRPMPTWAAVSTVIVFVGSILAVLVFAAIGAKAVFGW